MLFFGNLWRLISAAPQATRPTRRRKLVNELLEHRNLMAGDVLDSGDYCEPATATTSVAEESGLTGQEQEDEISFQKITLHCPLNSTCETVATSVVLSLAAH